MKKLIKIVIPLRNDKYYDSLTDIVSFTLNYSLAKIYELKLNSVFEILLVDWGSERKISGDIYINKKFIKNIKIVNVFKNSIKKNYKNIFNVSEAMNFGLSLTKNKYCLLAHADQIYSKTFFLNLASFAKFKYFSKKKTENALLYIPRKFVDDNFFTHNLSESTVDQYFESISFVNQKWKNDQYYIGGGHSGLFGATKTLKSCGGLKEDLMLKNKTQIIASDLEFYQRYSQHYKFYDSSNFGIFAYRYPRIFSKNRNNNLLERLPPITIDKPILKVIKKRKYKIYKSNKNKINKNFILKTSYYPKKGFFEKIKRFKYFSDLELRDSSTVTEKQKFVIKEVLFDIIQKKKIISYLEFGYSGSSTISVIGSIFKGIDILGADFTYKFSNQKVHKRLFKLAKYFNSSKKTYRFGKTKLLSFDKRDQSNFIFSYLPKEQFKSIMLINPFKMNLDKFKKFLKKNNKIFYCLILLLRNKKLNFLEQYFDKKKLYGDTYLFIHKSQNKNNKDGKILENIETYNFINYCLYKIVKFFFS